MTEIPVSVLPVTMPPTISCTSSFVRVAVMYPAPLVIALLFKEIFADPSKDTPAIVLAVVKVAADPVVFWLSVGILDAEIVPEDILSAFKLVSADPLSAGRVEGNLASGIVPSPRSFASSEAYSS